MRAFIYLRCLIPAIFLSVSYTASADVWTWEVLDTRADSLKSELLVPGLGDKQKLDLYSHLTAIYAGYAMDSVIFYAPQAIELAEKLKDFPTATGCYFHLAAANSFLGNFDKSLECLERAKELAIKDGNRVNEGGALSLTAFAYVQQAKYSTAIDYYLKSLEIYEKENYLFGQLKILTNLAEIYRKINNPEMALSYLDSASKLFETAPDPWLRFHIANEYAANYLDQGELEKALEYALLADSLNNGRAIINKCLSKCMLAKIYLKKGDYDKALEYAGGALEQADVLKDITLYLNTRKIFSDIYLAQGRYAEAEEQALLALQIDSTNIDESRGAAANLVEANIRMGNIERAISYFALFRDLSDRFSDRSFHTTVSDLAVKYETEKKEIRIADLERQRMLYVYIGIAGALLALALAIVLRQKIKNARRERQLIATRSVLDGEMRERTRLARDLHDRLSGSLSAVKISLDDSQVSSHNFSGKLDSCLEEIRRVAHNLMPVSLQYGIRVALEDFTKQFPNVRFHFFGEERKIEERKEFVLYCCANELVNNSVKHSGAKNINLQLIMHPKHVTLTVQDNGLGFDEKTAVRGMGLKSIHDRVMSCEGKIDIATSPGKGTETTVEIKIENIKDDKSPNC